jgi:small subunit ribosomal protein S4
MKSIKEKKERSLGVKLFLKADRCTGAKCAMTKRAYRPGVHGQKRKKAPSDYGRQLQEKQKIQILYGLSNVQMENVFEKFAIENIVPYLEKRLDRVVYMGGIAKSLRVARQMVSHGHIVVNGRKVTIPSFSVKIGDVVSVRPESKDMKIFEDAPVKAKQFKSPSWFKISSDMSIEMKKNPDVEELGMPFDINLVGQFYSR